MTVSQTKDLTNQMVQVSWTGFTPSSQLTYDNTATDYPVMIAECTGLDPDQPDECYGATNGGEPASFGAVRAEQHVLRHHESDGTGTADILLFTSVQNQYLDCGATHPCSLVVVPSQGGDSLDFATPDCANHTEDTGGTDLGQYAFTPITSASYTANGLCSWQKRIVIPLYFAPTPTGCPLRAADFTRRRLADAGRRDAAVADRPLLRQRLGRDAVQRVAERERGAQLLRRGHRRRGVHDAADVRADRSTRTSTRRSRCRPRRSGTGWTTRTPASRTRRSSSTPGCCTKMLTTSYAYTNDACPNGGSAAFGCDNAVDDNPQNLYADPEFQQAQPEPSGRTPPSRPGTRSRSCSPATAT